MDNRNTGPSTPDMDELVRKIAIELQVAMLRVELFNFVENDHTGQYVGVLDEDETAFYDAIIAIGGVPAALFEAAVERYWLGVDEIAERAS